LLKKDFESITGKVVGTVNGKKIAWKCKIDGAK
jgi:hypothetical protein